MVKIIGDEIVRKVISLSYILKLVVNDMDVNENTILLSNILLCTY